MGMSNIDHVTAHTELSDKLLPHYLLGRQLAMEAVLRELVGQLPAGRRSELMERLKWESECAIKRASDPGAQMGVMHASDCGFACGLIQMGF